MTLFGGVIPITGVTFLIFSVFVIAALGYVLGSITFKGISLGSAGVFIIALLYGCLFYKDLEVQLPEFTSNALKIVENLGLILFVTSVGFIAGPKFFGNMKKNFKSYVLLGLVVIVSAGIVAVACIFLGRALGDVETETAVTLGAFRQLPCHSSLERAGHKTHPDDDGGVLPAGNQSFCGRG